MTSPWHEAFPSLVFTSGKKQAQAVLEGTTAPQMYQTLKVWRRKGCTKGRCWDQSSSGSPAVVGELQDPELSLTEGRTLSWTILWSGLLWPPEQHLHQPKKPRRRQAKRNPLLHMKALSTTLSLLPGSLNVFEGDVPPQVAQRTPSIPKSPPAR